MAQQRYMSNHKSDYIPVKDRRRSDFRYLCEGSSSLNNTDKDYRWWEAAKCFDQNYIQHHRRDLVQRLQGQKVTHIYNAYRVEIKLLKAWGATLTHLYLVNPSQLPINTICKFSASRPEGIPWKNVFCHTVKLINLTIRDCDMSKRLPSDICSMETLKELNLTACNLETLPANLKDLEKLEKLVLDENKFMDGLPKSVCYLPHLKELSLIKCQLSSLPDRFSALKIQHLNVSDNCFILFPKQLCDMFSVEAIIMNLNRELENIPRGILNMANSGSLKQLEVNECVNLVTPQYEACLGGFESIIQYLNDMEEEEKEEQSEEGGKKTQPHRLPVAVVAVIGESFAGKTSLVRSLQQGKRVFTTRVKGSSSDETTKVFDVETIKMDDIELKCIDVGGQEIYQLAYQLTLKNNFIPVLVVSIEKFKELCKNKSVGLRIPVHKLCFDWLCHFYLACPKLGPPFLVFTFADKVSDGEMQTMKKEFTDCVDSMKKDLVAEVKNRKENFQNIDHLYSDENLPVFRQEDIYVLGNELDCTVLGRIAEALVQRGKEVSRTSIPKLWEQIRQKLAEMDGPFLKLRDLIEILQIGKNRTQIILSFLHECGDILWYKDVPKLSEVIFHKIPSVTQVVNVFFHHDEASLWEGRQKSYNGGHSIIGDNAQFCSLVDEFRRTGLINQKLLQYLLQTETEFKSPHEVETATSLLTCFHLIYGPITRGESILYVVPYFSDSESLLIDNTSTEGPAVMMKSEVNFDGIPLPIYVYPQMSLVLLEMFPFEDDQVHVAKNGVSVYVGDKKMHIYLIHKPLDNVVTIQLVTPICKIDSAWQHMMEIVNKSINQVCQRWKAARPRCTLICSHCLIMGKEHPSRRENPEWCVLSQRHKLSTLVDGMTKCICKADTVLKALKFPCKFNSNDWVKRLGQYVETARRASEPEERKARQDQPPILMESPRPPQKTVELSGFRQSPAHLVSNLNTQATSKRATDMKSKQVSCKLEVVQPAKTEVSPTVTEERKKPSASAPPHEESGPPNIDSDSESVISDGPEVYDVILPKESGETQEDILSDLRELRRRPERTNKGHIRALYNNTSKVYQMTNRRGMALIINNKHFPGYEKSDRHGSEVDFRMIKIMFSEFHFKIIAECDKTASQMLEIIRTVVGSPDHKDYGMFVLVIMSHGTENGKIYGTDLSCITSEEIEDALSHTNFPAMKGKPKLIIIQACRGGRPDREEKPDGMLASSLRSDNAISISELDMDVVDDGTSTGDEISARRQTIGLRDDLVVMRSSFESFVSLREVTYGSIFIRALVTTFYKHAAHRHIYDLFLMVQERVRRSGEMLDKKTPSIGGQTPTCITTLTRYRKLYLFPRYHGPTCTIRHDGIEKTDDGQSDDPVECYVEYKASDLKMPTKEEDDSDDDYYSDDFEDDEVSEESESGDEEEIKEEINMRMATPQKKTRTLSNRR